MAANDHETRNRARKAMRLALAIWNAFERLPETERPARLDEHMATAPELERNDWARVAGVNPPSESTWAVVIDCLRIREQMRAAEPPKPVPAPVMRSRRDFTAGDRVEYMDGMRNWAWIQCTVERAHPQDRRVEVREDDGTVRRINRDWLRWVEAVA